LRIKIETEKSNSPTWFEMGAATNPKGVTMKISSQGMYYGDKPMLPVMGEFHYARFSETEWRKELLKMKAGGINIIARHSSRKADKMIYFSINLLLKSMWLSMNNNPKSLSIPTTLSIKSNNASPPDSSNVEVIVGFLSPFSCFTNGSRNFLIESKPLKYKRINSTCIYKILIS
jgi:hypothetical protein